MAARSVCRMGPQILWPRHHCDHYYLHYFVIIVMITFRNPNPCPFFRGTQKSRLLLRKSSKQSVEFGSSHLPKPTATWLPAPVSASVFVSVSLYLYLRVPGYLAIYHIYTYISGWVREYVFISLLLCCLLRDWKGSEAGFLDAQSYLTCAVEAPDRGAKLRLVFSLVSLVVDGSPLIIISQQQQY